MADNNGNSAEDQFKAFEAAGEVEIGDSNAGVETPASKPSKGGGSGRPPRQAPKPAEPAAKPAAAEPGEGGEEGEPGEGEELEPGEGEAGEEGGEGEGEGEEKPKPARSAKDRIRDLNQQLRQQQRLNTGLEARLAALEKTGLPQGGAAAKPDAIGASPDPTDTAKYPLGHLDERYVEDKLEWLATKKAAETADAALQRQQESDSQRQANEARDALLIKVDDLATRGSEQFDDFQETVVDAGMRGDWDLSQSTFEAAHEAEHGAQILYELSKNKAEASRVAKLSPFGQLQFVSKRNAEIEAAKKPRTTPRAPAPAQTQTRGANSSKNDKPDTDNLDDFEKQWARDAKKSGR